MTPVELVGSLAASVYCELEAIRIGPFRETVRGVQVVRARCPLNAAIRLAELRVKVGWSAVRIKMLQARPTQYYKCWNYGHLRNSCKAEVDRQGSCFGCGSREHNVKDCRASPCLICQDKGLSFTHRLESATCESLANSRRKSARRGRTIDTKLVNNSRS